MRVMLQGEPFTKENVTVGTCGTENHNLHVMQLLAEPCRQQNCTSVSLQRTASVVECTEPRRRPQVFLFVCLFVSKSVCLCECLSVTQEAMLH